LVVVTGAGLVALADGLADAEGVPRPLVKLGGSSPLPPHPARTTLASAPTIRVAINLPRIMTVLHTRTWVARE
jgi:hypothetical protein